MVILISGASHTGKTALSERLMKKYNIPYFSIDHLKMGLIRSGQTSLTVYDDRELTAYLWDIVKEMVKTVVENGQNLIIEGCYIPFDFEKDFDESYLKDIKYYCIVMTERYLENNFADVLKYENVIEKRMASEVNKTELIAENRQNLQLCKKYGLNSIIVDGAYEADIDL